MNDKTRRRQKRRRNLYVDCVVQGAIIKRVLIYWSACMLFLTLPIILAMTVSNPSILWIKHVPAVLERFWPVYLVMVALLPFLIRDAVSLSHRFCGPVTRLLIDLREYSETGVYNKIRFRDHDFWKPMATAINAAVAQASGETKSETPPSST